MIDDNVKEELNRVIRDLKDNKGYHERWVWEIRQTYRDVDVTAIPILENVCMRIEMSANALDRMIKTLEYIEKEMSIVIGEK